jgi:hypothetical protein
MPYERSKPWLEFFGHVAKCIVADLAPTTVLEAGCAIGMLVEALRARQVDAKGFDISEYAIQQAPPTLAPYVWNGSLIDPNAAQGHYDLVVCIEIVEHLRPEDADKAVENLCRWSDRILFSSTPEVYNDTTHFNVQPPGYWAEKFARYGFIRNLDYDANYLSHWAMLLERRSPVWPAVIQQYENKLWRTAQENRSLRDLAGQLQRSSASPLPGGDAEKRITELERQLHGMTSSRGWQLISTWWRFRKRVARLFSSSRRKDTPHT